MASRFIYLFFNVKLFTIKDYADFFVGNSNQYKIEIC